MPRLPNGSSRYVGARRLYGLFISLVRPLAKNLADLWLIQFFPGPKSNVRQEPSLNPWVVQTCFLNRPRKKGTKWLVSITVSNKIGYVKIVSVLFGWSLCLSYKVLFSSKRRKNREVIKQRAARDPLSFIVVQWRARLEKPPFQSWGGPGFSTFGIWNKWGNSC